VSAEGIDDFEKELNSFKEKNAAALNVGSTAPKKEEAVKAPSPLHKGSPLSQGAAAAPESDTAVPAEGGSPLGAAGELPVSGQPPLTARAMDLQPAEETQAQMEESARILEEKVDKATFDEALKSLLPLKPSQIRKVLDSFKESREAAETPINMPEPRVEVQTVSLDPSQTPAVIKTAAGRVTTITVLDETGSPWPIQDVSWAGKFDVTPPEEGGHVIRVTPQTAHGAGNISIRLVDLITPITFTLTTGLDEVFYRFDARIPKAGPLAKTPLIEYGGLKTATGADSNLVQILDGVPPTSSEKLKVEGVDGRTNVWRVSGRIYLRTPLTLLSPAWNASVTSADGMNVYNLNDTPVILLSDEGRMVQAHIAAEEVSQ